MKDKAVELAEKAIGYTFKNKDLLEVALTHSSFVNEGGGKYSNERMEFLGDAILDAIVSDDIYRIFPEKDEGYMSKLRASVVSEQPLYKLSKRHNLDKFMLMGHGEISEHGMEKPSLLSDCFEAVVAAIYLDGGFEKAKKWVNSIITKDVYNDDDIKACDYKSKLYEMLAKNGKNISFKVISENGPVHDRIFEVGVYINGKLSGTGKGTTKKSAEQEASKKCLENYEV